MARVLIILSPGQCLLPARSGASARLWKTLTVLSGVYRGIDPGKIQRMPARAPGKIRDLEAVLLATCAERLDPSENQ